MSIVTARSASSLDQAILAQRSALHETARASKPLRRKRSTRNWERIDIVQLNPDQLDTAGEADITINIEERRAA